jgi:hypothetical protein
MKTLKFASKLCEKILSGEKTSTWRLFDDKDIQEGDELEMVNKETGDVIGVAKVSALKIRTLGTLTDEDWEGHEPYASEEEMYKTFRGFYGDKVNPDTEVKIIDFTFQST